MRISIILFFILCQFSLFSQMNETEAKAAYMLAEENYGKANYPLALTFLKNAQKSLGGSNCKILYLQIQIEKEVSKTQKNYRDSLIKTITAFQVSPDIKDFNEDKVLEVIKMKMELEQVIAEEKFKKQKEMEYDEMYKFPSYFKEQWKIICNVPYQQSLAEAKNIYLNFFKSSVQEKSNLFFGLDQIISKSEKRGLTLYVNPKKNITGIKIRIEISEKDSRKNDYTLAKNELIRNVKLISEGYGFNPVSESLGIDGLKFIWKKNQLIHIISWEVSKNGKSGYFGNYDKFLVDQEIQ